MDTAVAMRLVDWILSEWLSAAITTLPEAKMALITMCHGGVHTPSNIRHLKVEACGSGAIIVPCFQFTESTTTRDLFRVIRQHLKQPQLFRLFFGDQELLDVRPEWGFEYRLVADLSLKDNCKVVFVVERDEESLEKGGCTAVLFCSALHFYCNISPL